MTKKILLPGRTPLKARLIPGDYFCVAVMNPGKTPASRFHEVFRHVPGRSEQMPLARAHNAWKIDRQGTVVLPVITIPPPDITNGMTLIPEGTVMESGITSANQTDSPMSIHVSAFFADQAEATVSDVQACREYGSTLSAFPPMVSVRFDEAVDLAERLGKRLPFAAELALLESTADRDDTNESQHPTENDSPDRSRLGGVKSQLWEWTMTHAGGPAAGLPSTQLGSLGATSRVVRNGISNHSNARGSAPAKLQAEHQLEPLTGFRMVRSASPLK